MDSYIREVIDTQIIKRVLEDSIKNFRQFDDMELAGYLTFAHYMRFYLVEQKIIPDDILTNFSPDPDVWVAYLEKVTDFYCQALEKEDRTWQMRGGAAAVWMFTIAYIVEDALFRRLVKDFWQELSRGFDFAYSQWQKTDFSVLGCSCSNTKAFSDIQVEIVTIPEVTFDQPYQDNYTIQNQETPAETWDSYEKIVANLRKLEPTDIDMILAVAHAQRIILTRDNVFPDDILENPTPKAFQWQQYRPHLESYMDEIDSKESSYNKSVQYLAVLAWQLVIESVLLSETGDNSLKDVTKRVWQELMRGREGAYKRFCNITNPMMITEKTQPLLNNMEEDIKKTPAVLLD